MTQAGKHHTSALCHIAPALLTRIIACWRTGERYILRDIDGREVQPVEARAIIARRYTVPADVRSRQTRVHFSPRTGRRGQRSPSASSADPFARHATTAGS